MPELPEVETMVSDLNKKVRGRRIKSVRLSAPKILKSGSPAFFKKNIAGKRIIGIRRLAKNILFDLSGGFLLAVHPKMTGHFLYGQSPGRFKHIRLALFLDNGQNLYFNDMRKFGRILFGPREKLENSKELKSLGPDALAGNLTLKKFKEILSVKKGKIKSVLMDQQTIAGIGNIYSDEILFTAKIHPLTLVSSLGGNSLAKIFSAMKKILKKAVLLRGSSLSDFFDLSGEKGTYGDRRLVYGRVGQPCRRCQTPIKRIKINGRSSYFCPRCQPDKEKFK